VPAVGAAVSALLSPHGRFVCNIGTNRRPDGSAADPPNKPSLHDLMRAYAMIDHNYVFRPTGARRLVRDHDLHQQLTGCGLSVERTEYVEYPFDPDQTYAWSRIPIFTAHFDGLSYQQRMDALDKAWARFDRQDQPPSRWAILVATAPTGARSAR
jgi:hypothetical protein